MIADTGLLDLSFLRSIISGELAYSLSSSLNFFLIFPFILFHPLNYYRSTVIPLSFQRLFNFLSLAVCGVFCQFKHEKSSFSVLPISFPLSKNPQAGSIRFFSLHPRVKLRLSVIFFFYLIIVDFSVSDSSFLSPPSRLIVFLYKMYKMLLSDFLSLPLFIMNTSSPCFSNTSYPIHLSSLLSQRLLQSQTNTRIIGLDQSLPWGFIAILHKYLCNKEMCAEGRFTRWKTKSLPRFPKIPISHRNTFVPYSFSSSFPQLIYPDSHS